MQRKNLIWIGCGGCLSIVLLIVLGIVFAGFWVGNKITEIQEVEEEIATLDQQYPFTPPENHTIQPERFTDYLQTRKEFTLAIDEFLQPILQLPQKLEQPDQTSFNIVRTVIETVISFPTMRKSQLKILHQAQMSSDEYHYWTKVMAREISTWIDLDAAEEKQTMAEEYFGPLKNFTQTIEEWDQNHPNSEINDLPFDYNLFMRDLKDWEYLNEENAPIVFQHKEEILFSDTAIFIDSFIIQTNP